MDHHHLHNQLEDQTAHLDQTENPPIKEEKVAHLVLQVHPIEFILNILSHNIIENNACSKVFCPL